MEFYETSIQFLPDTIFPRPIISNPQTQASNGKTPKKNKVSNDKRSMVELLQALVQKNEDHLKANQERQKKLAKNKLEKKSGDESDEDAYDQLKAEMNQAEEISEDSEIDFEEAKIEPVNVEKDKGKSLEDTEIQVEEESQDEKKEGEKAAPKDKGKVHKVKKRSKRKQKEARKKKRAKIQKKINS